METLCFCLMVINVCVSVSLGCEERSCGQNLNGFVIGNTNVDIICCYLIQFTCKTEFSNLTVYNLWRLFLSLGLRTHILSSGLGLSTVIDNYTDWLHFKLLQKSTYTLLHTTFISIEHVGADFFLFHFFKNNANVTILHLLIAT